MGSLINRRAAIVRLLASGAALGLGAFATSGRAAPARAATLAPASLPTDEPPLGPIPVRLAEIVHEGAAFRDGAAKGISLPGQGGTWELTAAQPGGTYTSPSFQLEFPCTHVGVHWRTDASDVGALTHPQAGLGVEVRSSRDGAGWSSWRRVLVEAHGRDAAPDPAFDETFGALIGGRRGSWLQYRLTFGEGWSPERGIQRVTLTYLDAGVTPPERLGMAPPPGPLPTAVERGSSNPSPLSIAMGRGWGWGLSGGESDMAKLGAAGFIQRVIPREVWGADESLRFKDGQDQWLRAYVSPKLMVVHHTATDNVYADPAAEVRAIFVYHTVTQGWGDIGYHMLIDNRGQVYEGRLGRAVDPANPSQREIVSRDIVAGHALTYNYGSVGIAMLGNFMEEEPSGPALDTLHDALTFTASRYNIDPLTKVDFLRGASTDIWRDGMNILSGHRDCITTECPGDKLYPRLPGIRQAVADRIGASGARAKLARTPEDKTLWPTDLVFGWDGSAEAVEYSTRLEAWRPGALPDTIEPLSGYDPDEFPVWSPWTRATDISLALPPDARGHYTLLVRARDAAGREGAYYERWPMFVDRHVLVDDAAVSRSSRTGDWESSNAVLGYNGVGYMLAQPGSAAAPSDAPPTELATPGHSIGFFSWRLPGLKPGSTYRVLACWPSDDSFASDAHFQVLLSRTWRSDFPRLADVRVNQQEQGSTWVELATITIDEDPPDQPDSVSVTVVLSNDADGIVVADAVRAVLVAPAAG